MDRPASKKVKKNPVLKLAKGEKLSPKHPGITKKLKGKLIVGRRFTDPIAIAINGILSVAVRQFFEFGLIRMLVDASSDETCISTGASTYGKKLAGAKARVSTIAICTRRFSGSRVSWVWDCHNDCSFYGYTGSKN